MVLALLAALASVAAGAALGSFRDVSGPRLAALFYPIQTFALAAVLTSVFAHLLPEAISGVGPWALVVFAAGIALPPLAMRLGGDEHHSARGHAMAFELGFVGLMIHKVADGVALAVFTSGEHSAHNHLDIIIGIAAHTIPVTAIIVIAFAKEHGRRPALLRAALLAVAVAAGMGATVAGGEMVLEAAAPWATAALAGLLLHILAHDLPVTSERTAGVRVGEALGLILGVAVPLVLSGHGHEHGHTHSAILSAPIAIAELALQLSPALLLGLLGTALLSAFRRASDTRRWQSLAAPELCLATVLTTAVLLGGVAAAARLVTALVLARLLRLFLASTAVGAPREAAAPPERSFVAVIDAYVVRTGPWLIVGLVAGSYAQLLLAPGALQLASWLEVPLGTAAAIALARPQDHRAVSAQHARHGHATAEPAVAAAPALPAAHDRGPEPLPGAAVSAADDARRGSSLACSGGLVLLAAALIAKGTSLGAAIAGLVVVSMIPHALVGSSDRASNATRTWGAALALFTTATLLGWLINALALPTAPPAWTHGELYRSLGWLSLSALAALVVRSVWRFGAQAWLSSER